MTSKIAVLTLLALGALAEKPHLYGMDLDDYFSQIN